MPYRQQAVPQEEIAAQDPFGGAGIRLDFPDGTSRAEGEEMTEIFLGDIPHVTWDTHAWADGSSLSAERKECISRTWSEAVDR